LQSNKERKNEKNEKYKKWAQKYPSRDHMSPSWEK
jgi:hypothetical protein